MENTQLHNRSSGVSVFLNNSRIDSTGKATEGGFENGGLQSSNGSHSELKQSVYTEKFTIQGWYPFINWGLLVSDCPNSLYQHVFGLTIMIPLSYQFPVDHSRKRPYEADNDSSGVFAKRFVNKSFLRLLINTKSMGCIIGKAGAGIDDIRVLFLSLF